MRSRLASLKTRIEPYGVPAFYWWATYTLRGVLWVVGRWVVTGRENIPSDGALLVEDVFKTHRIFSGTVRAV